MATGSSVDPQSVRDLILSRPALLGRGVRVLQTGFRLGRGRELDALAVDGTGNPLLVTVADGDSERTLARLMDAHVACRDQSDLLARLFPDGAVQWSRPARSLLLAPSFTHAFLERLSLLAFEVTPFLARAVSLGDDDRATVIEPAAPIFGLDGNGGAPRPERSRDDVEAFWPEGVLPSRVARGEGRPVPATPQVAASETAPSPADPLEAALSEEEDDEPPPVLELEDLPWPGAPEDLPRWEPEPRSERRGFPPIAEGPLSVPEPAFSAGEPDILAEFETLSAEELEEFERFERSRRERGR